MDEVDATVRPEVAGSSGESTGALEAVACANCENVLNTDGLNNQLSGVMNSECHLLEQVSQNPDLIERSDLAEVSYKNFIFIIPRKVLHTCSESCFSYEATQMV